MTKETVSRHITSATAAIVAVHLYGLRADIGGMLGLGFPIIEDACQRFPARVQHNVSQERGVVSILSFHATKCLTTAEGGMLTSDDRDILSKAVSIRDGGASSAPRLTAPMSDLQAVLGLSQLNRYSLFVNRRTEILEQYLDALKKQTRLQPKRTKSDFLFRLPLRIDEQFDSLQKLFHNQRIQVRRGVDELLHRGLGQNDEAFPNATALYRQTISIPFYPALTPEECSRVCAAIENM
jgi:UDP-4-amino-4-deoxy-L-arabinose-oxoglutarate aminotransferase